MLGGRIGRGVRPWCVRRDGTVIDNTPTYGRLALHELERFLRTQKCPGQVGVDDGFPLLVGEVFERYGRRTGPCIVEQDVQPAKGLLRLGKEGADGGRITDYKRRSTKRVTLLAPRIALECHT